MSFDRLRVQTICESLVGCKDVDKWNSYQSAFQSLILSPANCAVLTGALRDDASDLYAKGLLSFCEGISNIDRQAYSWSAVKLYYAVFYFLRASLAAANYSLVRNKSLYQLLIEPGQSPQKKKQESYRNDHVAIVNIYADVLGVSDPLSANDIAGQNPYHWLMDKRHQVHYRQRIFHDPSPPDFMIEIVQKLESVTLHTLLSTYLEREDLIYCFLESDACVALPLLRGFRTMQDLARAGISVRIVEEQSNLLKVLTASEDAQWKDLDQFLGGMTRRDSNG